MTNPVWSDHTDIYNLQEEEEQLLISEEKFDENRNNWKNGLEDVHLGEDRKQEKPTSSDEVNRQDKRCISKMTTVRGYLQARKQYLPTVLLMICSTIYLPYSYVSVLHAREEQMADIRTNSGFQKVINRSHVLFSAYLDDRFPREPAKLRILGFKSKSDDRALYCKLYFNDGTAQCLPNPAIELRLDTKNTQQNQDIQCLFHCTLPDKTDKPPLGVTLTSSKTCQTNDHIVAINPVQGDPILKKDIAVCFATPSSEFPSKSDRHYLVEILEMSRLFGASVVQMYNESMDVNLQQLLQPYITSGFLSVLPWNPGDRYLPGLARALSMNDCIYRNAAKFRSIVFVDRDEIILPSSTYKSSWAELVSNMRNIYPGAGAFWFEEALYVTAKGLKGDTKVQPLAKTCPLGILPEHQLPRIFTHRFLSRPLSRPKSTKYSQMILDPSVVLYMDTDRRVAFLPGKSSIFLATEAGQSIHFTNYKSIRDFENTMETLETHRSKYNIKVAKAIYNKLNFTKKLDLSGCD